ncbi:hypothetical protein O7606_03440 [Micromonospora sp. WMMD882]|uniref:hypothetical protein n=1 Tax=Micromonospora sp. WMMD882 TaxID=3015151 RepID=UPI00248CD926|nr:hypothetical protein [Micromonospora sp. WMMD882]WBB80450.1 hypothetical protein O7606_03440 [Micromonospora sp. WMMD882]
MRMVDHDEAATGPWTVPVAGDTATAHVTLLGLAGRTPDDVLADARLRLADGLLPGPVTPVLAPVATYAFRAGPDAGGPPLLDLTGAALDPPDRAATAAVAGLTGATALWRSFRGPASWDPPGTAPTRVYVLAADVPPGRLPALTATVMRALASAGVPAPQVEAYAPDTDLPGYQRSARGASALLWTSTPRPPVRLARVFDRGGADGPRFDPDHERLADPERGRVADWLAAGEPILATTRTAVDVVEPGRGAVVPLSFRTDGQWVWTDTVTYYLRGYALAPDRALLDHIRARDYAAVAVDAAGEHRALATLLARAGSGAS